MSQIEYDFKVFSLILNLLTPIEQKKKLCTIVFLRRENLILMFSPRCSGMIVEEVINTYGDSWCLVVSFVLSSIALKTRTEIRYCLMKVLNIISLYDSWEYLLH